MCNSLLSSRGFAAGITLASVIFGLFLAPVANAAGTLAAKPLAEGAVTPQSLSLAPVELEQDEPVQTAHNHDAGGASLGSVVTAAPVVTGLAGRIEKGGLSNSLWVNLLIAMAYQRDPEIQKLARKINRVDSLTLLTVAGISGLGLAQGISALSNTPGAQALHVVNHGQGDHVHTEPHSRTPATLGVIGSSATLATIGIRAVMNRGYTNHLAKRQLDLRQQVESLVARLKAGEDPHEIEHALAEYVGPLASQEFIQLWQSAQQ
jgi:hypothetical protein